MSKPAGFTSARSLTVRELFALGQFEPARAQRDYQWEEDQWRALLNDLIAAFIQAGLDPDEGKSQDADMDGDRSTGIAPTNEPVEAPPPAKKLRAKAQLSFYFLGHMLMMPRSGGYWIYDGQQRLTTLTLMLCALRDTPGGLEVWDTIQKTLRTPPPDNKPRLLNPTSGGALSRILKIGGTSNNDWASFEPADRRMYGAGRFFQANTYDWSAARWRAFTEFLLDRVYVTMTETADRRLLEFAYVTINTRGKPLEHKDVIKGHFSHLASRQGLTAANRMTEKWDRFERKAERHTEQILRMAFILEFQEKPVFDFATQLMDQFDGDDTLAEAEEWVGVKLPALADVHQKYTRNILQPDVLRSVDANLRRLTFLPWKYWQAVVFALAQRDKNAPNRFAQSVASLTRWCFVVNLIDVDDDRILNKAVDAVAQIRDKRDPFDYRRDRGVLGLGAKWRKRAADRLQDGQVTDNQRRGAHVRWIETLYWPHDEVDFRATEATNVEHVFPRRPGGQWLRDFPAQQHIQGEKFGNLCLLPKDVNERLFVSEYHQKRPEFLRLPSHYKSAHDVAGAEAWTPAAVDARTQRLAEAATKALQLG